MEIIITVLCNILFALTSTASERIKNPINRRNNALTNPARTSALTYLQKINNVISIYNIALVQHLLSC